MPDFTERTKTPSQVPRRMALASPNAATGGATVLYLVDSHIQATRTSRSEKILERAMIADPKKNTLTCGLQFQGSACAELSTMTLCSKPRS